MSAEEYALRCPCCGDQLGSTEYVFNAAIGEVRTNVLHCPLRCDLFYDDEARIWRDYETWEPWDGVPLEPQA